MLIAAPTTAVVHTIPFQVGTKVNAGDTVVLLECMKILMNITTEASGIVSEIFVTPGDLVEQGQELLEIKEDK